MTAIRASDILVPSQRTPVDRDFYNKRFKIFMDAINDVNSRQDAYDITVNDLIALGLQRIDQTLGPLLVTLQDAAQLGFLVCKSVGTSVTLVAGNTANFVVTDGGDLFTPTPYLLAIDDNDETNWGVVLVDQWTPETGDLATHCVYATQALASTAWNISCNSALPAALAGQVNGAAAARDEAVAAAETVAAEMASLAELAAAIEEGPVASVAGRTGIIELAMTDIVGLIDALAAKAASSWVTSQLSGKQNTSSILDTLIALTLAADRLIYATGPGALALTTFTSFARTLLDDANASTALSTLGVSTFAKTLLDDSDAAAARATLGVEATPEVPVKATLGETLTGTDDAKFVTPADAAGVYSKKTLDLSIQAADFTLGTAHNGKTISWTKATAGTITLSNDAPAGTECLVLQEGAGQITFAAQSGATVGSYGNKRKSGGQYSMVTALVISNSGSSAAWRLGGSLVA